MVAARPEYRYGRILGCYLRGRNGKSELHPAVIVSPDAEIAQPEVVDPRKVILNPLAVLGVSTRYQSFNDPCIPLPFHPTSHPVTRLSRDCAVILNWYAVIAIPDDCHFFAGDVPPGLMRQINAAIRNHLTTLWGTQVGTLAQLLSRLHPRG